MKQVIGEFNVGFIDLINQQYHFLVGFERFPQLAFLNVVADIVNTIVTELRITQARYRVIFIEALLGFSGRLDVPSDDGHVQRLGHFLGKHGLTGAWLPLNEQWSL